MINEMETISITYRGIVHKLTEYEKLVDTIEMIYTMCDQKITHWGDSITGKNGGKVKKYKRGKILYNSLKNDNLERVSFFSLPEDFVTAAFDYTIYISINYKEKYITAVFEKNVLKNEKIESIKNVLASYMEVLELLKNTCGTWEIKEGNIYFQNKADEMEYQKLIEKLQKLA